MIITQWDKNEIIALYFLFYLEKYFCKWVYIIKRVFYFSRKYLSCPKSFPLHEVFYYDSAADVKRQLNSSPRSAVQTALATPHHYLQVNMLSDVFTIWSTLQTISKLDHKALTMQVRVMDICTETYLYVWCI